MNRHVGDAFGETRRSNDRRGGRGFTLVELLVVAGILGLLTAILAPAARQAGRRARAVACRSRLRQWGMGLSAFVNELDPPLINTSTEAWDRFYRPYCDPRNNLFICPMATRHRTNTADPYRMAWESTGCGLGSKFTAWKLPLRTPTSREAGHLLGSYGPNCYGLALLDMQTRSRRKARSSNIPIFVDCVSWSALVSCADGPPRYEGELAKGGIKECCIDRHDGAINGLFLDWSVRKVGLKELWTLEWSPGFDAQNAWTRAGGVQPEDWPQWMRGFQDY